MLRSRTSRFFGQPSPEKTFADVAREIGAVIKRDRQRSSDVILASYSIGCDGRPTVSLLDGSPCDPDGEMIGLATRDRALLSGVLPRPFQSNSADTGTFVSSVQSIGVASGIGRYFVDSLGAHFEGRNGIYHSGRGGASRPNGTLVAELTGQESEQDTTGDLRFDWNYPYSGDLVNYNPEQYDGENWQSVLVDDCRTPGAPDATYTAAFHFPGFLPFYSLEPWGEYAGGPAPEAAFNVPEEDYYDQSIQAYEWVGRTEDTAQYIVGIEGWFVAYGAGDGPYIGTMKTRLTVRDVSTLAVVAYRDLTEVESHALSAHPARCASPAYAMPWRAGIQVRPAPDGTFVVSVMTSNTAWVYGVVSDGTSVQIVLHETVIFPTGYDGVIRVAYK